MLDRDSHCDDEKTCEFDEVEVTLAVSLGAISAMDTLVFALELLIVADKEGVAVWLAFTDSDELVGVGNSVSWGLPTSV